MVELNREALKWTSYCCLAILLSGLTLSPAVAVIETLTSLDKFVADADLILVANVQQLDLKRGRLVLAVESRLQGEDPASSLPVKLAGNANEALAGVSQGDNAVLFVSQGKEQDLAYVYVRGAWFLMIGTRDQDRVRWQFKAGEPYLRRTYSDETAQLVHVLTANLAGTGGLPTPDPAIPTGYGLLPGKHPVPTTHNTSKLSASPASASSGQPSVVPQNVPLALAAAGCAIAIVIMLTRSQPLEDANA
jgi:hypothetical protein